MCELTPVMARMSDQPQNYRLSLYSRVTIPLRSFSDIFIQPRYFYSTAIIIIFTRTATLKFLFLLKEYFKEGEMVDIHPIILSFKPKCICDGQPSHPFSPFRMHARKEQLYCSYHRPPPHRAESTFRHRYFLHIKRRSQFLEQATCARANLFYIWWNPTNSY